jgi:uncharacterized protein YbjT (DUF2867 family)
MILLTGATGPTGRAILTGLVAQGLPVRALAHRPERVAELQALGAQEAVVGDLLDAASVRSALAGCAAVYHIPPSVNPREAELDATVLQAAVEAGVAHFVFHSLLHPQLSAIPHHLMHLRMEDQLLQSGLPFTILQPTSYMQNWSGRLREATLYVPWGPDAPLSMVDLADVGEVAALVLSEPGHLGATYELCGSDLTFTQIARLMSEATGQAVGVQRISVAAWQDMLRKFGQTEEGVALLGKMAEFYDTGRFVGSAKVLTCLLGRPPHTFAEVLQRELAS